MTVDEQKTRAMQLRAQGATYRTIALQLGVAKATAQRWIDPAARRAEQRRYERERKRAYRAAQAGHQAVTSHQAFTRAYMEALEHGRDLLEERDAIYECGLCLQLPGDCTCEDT